MFNEKNIFLLKLAQNKTQKKKKVYHLITTCMKLKIYLRPDSGKPLRTRFYVASFANWWLQVRALGSGNLKMQKQKLSFFGLIFLILSFKQY